MSASWNACAPLVRKTHGVLRALDPARFDPARADGFRIELESIRLEFEQVAVDAEAALATRVADLTAVMSKTPTVAEASEWMSFREHVEPEYEALAEALRTHDVRVPTLRPSNLRRSVVHVISGLACAAFVELAPLHIVLWTASCAFALVAVVEGTRRINETWNARVMRLFGPIAHPYERYRINSGSNYVAALLVLAWMKHPAAGATGVVVLALADPAASFFGRRWGRTPLPYGRSVQGSLAFVVVGALGAFALLRLAHPEYVFGVAAIIAVSAAVVGALAEICSDVLDDNLTIPVLAGAAAWLMAMYVG